MAPQVVQDVIDWVFGRRRRKKTFYGNSVIWSIPGHGAGLGRGRASVRLLPDDSGEPDMGAKPVGQKQKVIAFDDKSDDRLSVDDGVADQELAGIDAEFAMIEEEKVVERKVPASDDSLYYIDKVTGFRVRRVADASPVREAEVVEQVPSDISNGNFPSEKEAEAVDQIPSDMSEDAFPPEEIKLDQISDVPKDVTIGVPVTENQTFVPTVSEVTDHTPELPMGQEIYKEEDMSDAYYVARDNGESNLVKQLHPNSSVMIPSDYDTAIEEIKSCPLDCPYKALELSEIDQKTLRGRIVK